MLVSPSVTAAAETVGVTARTMHRWLQDDAFARQIETARKRVFEHSLRRLSNLMEQAIDAIENILTDGTAKDRDRLRAASLVLSHGQASELADVLRELENQIQTMESDL